MSRTVRQKLRGKGKARDGEDLRPSRGCRHHGPCNWCEGNRTYSSQHRAPAAASDSELEDDDIEYDEAGNTWSG